MLRCFLIRIVIIEVIRGSNVVTLEINLEFICKREVDLIRE